MSVMSAATSRVVLPARRRARAPRSARSWLSTALGIFILAIMLFPVYWMINMSFQPSGNTLNSEFFPTQPSLDGYAIAIRDQGVNLLTSLVISLGVVVVSLAVAAPAAYALAQFRGRWVDGVLLAILISQMIPHIVIANALYTAYNDLGMLNSILGLILADSTTAIPFAILILRTAMAGVPSSIVEAARVDGAGLWRAFVAIVLPVARNGVITAALFSFLFSWSDFLFALTLTTTEEVRPVTLGIYTYLGTQVANWGAVMATAVLSSIPAILLLVLAQKFVAAGAAGGAVK